MYETQWKDEIEQFEDNMHNWMHDSTGTNRQSLETSIYDHLPIAPSDIYPAPIQGHWGFSPSDMTIFQTTARTTNPGFQNAASKTNPKGGGKGQKQYNWNQRYKNWLKNHKQPQQHHNGKSSGGGGGGKTQGAGSIPLPKLGNVPFQTTPASGSSGITGSPIMLILFIGIGGIAIWFFMHKVRKTKAEDTEMTAKGE